MTGDDGLRDGTRDGVGYSIPAPSALERSPRSAWRGRALALVIGAAATSGVVALRREPETLVTHAARAKDVAGACEVALWDVARSTTDDAGKDVSPAPSTPAPLASPPVRTTRVMTSASPATALATKEQHFSENRAPILE